MTRFFREQAAVSNGKDGKKGYVPPSKPELDKLIEQRKNDPPMPGPKYSPEGTHAPDYTRWNKEQAEIAERESRIRFVQNALDRSKGHARDDFKRKR